VGDLERRLRDLAVKGPPGYAESVTEQQAKAECTRLAAEHPDRRSHRWLPRRGADGKWSVVKIDLPPLEPSSTALSADERPTTPDDPRSSLSKNVPGGFGY